MQALILFLGKLVLFYFILQYVHLQKDLMFIFLSNTAGDLKKEAEKPNRVVSCKHYNVAIENRPNSVVAASSERW